VGYKAFVVVDGKEEKQYGGIGTLIFSPDSQRVAYGAKVRMDEEFVVVDGREEKRYDYIEPGSLIFSPGSKRVAYAARLGDKRFVVVDGKEEKGYDGIGYCIGCGDGTPIFSPDSRRVAYGAKAGKKWFWSWMGKRGSVTMTSALPSSARTASGWLMRLKRAKSVCGRGWARGEAIWWHLDQRRRKDYL
jgi:hypothetical protein